MKLVITEKPSVARDIARVLGAKTQGDGFISGDSVTLTWCLGHLLELEEPAAYHPDWKQWRMDVLPMIPETFDLKVRKGIKDRWTVVRRLLRDGSFSSVVNACDAGREGELIFRRAYRHAVSTLPIQRLWLSSMTDQAIRTAWGRLQDGVDYDPLAEAAQCRSRADWIVGLNATRAMTLLVRQHGGDRVMSVGRVQTPTLAMIVARDREIEAFVAKNYWVIKSVMNAEEGQWDGMLIGPKPKGQKDNTYRFDSEDTAVRVQGILTDASGVVTVNERKEKSTPPPLLYDLTNLQQRANQRYGFTADQTLTLAQSLYETHKILTYPRTDSRYLTQDQEEGLQDIIRGLKPISVYAPFCGPLLEAPLKVGSRVINDAEVGDHHAIIPTGRTPNSSRLKPDEKRIFDLVARRFLAALYPAARHERARIVVDVDPIGTDVIPDALTEPLQLETKGKVTLDLGWMAVDPPKSDQDRLLPNVRVGDSVAFLETKVLDKKTAPPKRYTDGTLLKAMETAGRRLSDAELKRAMRRSGLGTPATRAAILKTLLDRGFLQRKKRELWSTERGRGLLDAIPEDVVKSPRLTGEYESTLHQIAEGTHDPQQFMDHVATYTRSLVQRIQEADPPAVALDDRSDVPILGACPACGKPVREQRPVFACDTGRSCSFVVFKTMAKRKISARMVKDLLSKGRTSVVKGFRSKKGKDFEAGLMWQEDKVTFYFPPRPGGARTGDTCPECFKGKVIRGKTALGCTRWREGCGWRGSSGGETT